MGFKALNYRPLVQSSIQVTSYEIFLCVPSLHNILFCSKLFKYYIGGRQIVCFPSIQNAIGKS